MKKNRRGPLNEFERNAYRTQGMEILKQVEKSLEEDFDYIRLYDFWANVQAQGESFEHVVLVGIYAEVKNKNKEFEGGLDTYLNMTYPNEDIALSIKKELIEYI